MGLAGLVPAIMFTTDSLCVLALIVPLQTVPTETSAKTFLFSEQWVVFNHVCSNVRANQRCISCRKSLFFSRYIIHDQSDHCFARCTIACIVFTFTPLFHVAIGITMTRLAPILLTISIIVDVLRIFVFLSIWSEGGSTSQAILKFWCLSRETSFSRRVITDSQVKSSLVKSTKIAAPHRYINLLPNLSTNIVTKSPSWMGASIDARCALICSHFAKRSFIGCAL